MCPLFQPCLPTAGCRQVLSDSAHLYSLPPCLHSQLCIHWQPGGRHSPHIRKQVGPDKLDRKPVRQCWLKLVQLVRRGTVGQVCLCRSSRLWGGMTNTLFAAINSFRLKGNGQHFSLDLTLLELTVLYSWHARAYTEQVNCDWIYWEHFAQLIYFMYVSIFNRPGIARAVLPTLLKFIQ